MNTIEIIDFLVELNENNNYEWMKQNKYRYRCCLVYFEEMVQQFIQDLSKIDPTITYLNSKNLVFRLNRDTRFSHDKSPYKASFRAHISQAGRVPIPVGYYINIEPNNIFLGAGLFAYQFSDATKMVRDVITEKPNEFLKIICDYERNPNYKFVGEKLKNVPRGYDTNNVAAEYLKYKSWALEIHFKDEEFIKWNDFYESALIAYRKMKPFNDFINSALKDFKMPDRKR